MNLLGQRTQVGEAAMAGAIPEAAVSLLRFPSQEDKIPGIGDGELPVTTVVDKAGVYFY